MGGQNFSKSLVYGLGVRNVGVVCSNLREAYFQLLDGVFITLRSWIELTLQGPVPGSRHGTAGRASEPAPQPPPG